MTEEKVLHSSFEERRMMRARLSRPPRFLRALLPALSLAILLVADLLPATRAP